MNQIIVSAILVATLLGCASKPSPNQQSMSASFYDMKEETFSLQAIAPSEVIRQYAICKAIWFSEKKKATKLSLGDPIYNSEPRGQAILGAVPKGWAVVDATAYLAEQSPNGNPFVNVQEMASSCRKGWEWYQ